MSQAADVKLTINQDFMRKKLTRDERAQLLFDLDQDLEWDNYDTIEDAREEIEREERTS